jgi:hypothetical protein
MSFMFRSHVSYAGRDLSVLRKGITLPIRRRAYMRDKENRAIREKLMVSIDMSEVAFL